MEKSRCGGRLTSGFNLFFRALEGIDLVAVGDDAVDFCEGGLLISRAGVKLTPVTQIDLRRRILEHGASDTHLALVGVGNDPVLRNRGCGEKAQVGVDILEAALCLRSHKAGAVALAKVAARADDPHS